MNIPLIRFLRENFQAEQDRWPLGLPIAFGLGILTYFILPIEPTNTQILAIFSLIGALAALANHFRPLRILAWIIAFIGLGFFASWLRTNNLSTPMLSESTKPLLVVGTIESVETMPDGYRIILREGNLHSDRLPPCLQGNWQKDWRLRLKIRQKLNPAQIKDLSPGVVVKVTAMLMPFDAPSYDGGYDARRTAFFQGLFATGFTLSAPEKIGVSNDFAYKVERLRHNITQSIYTELPGTSGAIAAAMMTGHKSKIPDSIKQDFAGAGLAHIYVISGLHVSMVAGLIFWWLRMFLALFPYLALNFPIKKWALCITLAAMVGYMVISGSAIPVGRAVIMYIFSTFAVLIDRKALTIRSLGAASMVILSLLPEALLSPSFQLSFSAVAALIAAHEVVPRPGIPFEHHPKPTGLHRLISHLRSSFYTSFIATLGTTFLIVFFFNRLSLNTVLANIIAVPLTGAIVMPSAILAFLTWPIDCHAIPLAIMGYGIDAMLRIASIIASWPGSQIIIATPSLCSQALIICGGCWLLIWQRTWRWWGIFPICCGVLFMMLTPQPDVLIDANGRILGLNNGHGALLLSSRSKYIAERWASHLGLSETQVIPCFASRAKSEISFNSGDWGCTRHTCIHHKLGYTLSFDRIYADTKPFFILQNKAGEVLVEIDAESVKAYGAHSIFFNHDTPLVTTAKSKHYQRPWQVAQ